MRTCANAPTQKSTYNPRHFRRLTACENPIQGFLLVTASPTFHCAGHLWRQGIKPRHSDAGSKRWRAQIDQPERSRRRRSRRGPRPQAGREAQGRSRKLLQLLAFAYKHLRTKGGATTARSATRQATSGTRPRLPSPDARTRTATSGLVCSLHATPRENRRVPVTCCRCGQSAGFERDWTKTHHRAGIASAGRSRKAGRLNRKYLPALATLQSFAQARAP